MQRIDLKRELIGCYLMAAFNLSFETADIYIIGEDLERVIDALNLPNKQCSECGKGMTFFYFHLCQGICEECATRISEELESEA